MAKTTTPKKLKDVKSLSGYDFIDLGSGDGASLINNQKIIGGRGLGVEFNRSKVIKATDLGRNVVLGDVLDMHKIHGKADFVTCDNFLEHLLSYGDVEKVLAQALKVAKKFIYIRHPAFEHLEYLNKLGLKTYWSDWHGHTSMLTISDIESMLRYLGVETIKIVPVSLIKDSSDPRIIPLKAPRDQHHYEKVHGKKPSPKIVFNRPIYYAFDIIAVVPGADQFIPKLVYKDRLNDDSRPKFIIRGNRLLSPGVFSKTKPVAKHSAHKIRREMGKIKRRAASALIR